MARRKNRQKRSYASSSYRLAEVVKRIDNGHVIIKKNAQEDAYRQFGWKLLDIKNAYKKLRPKHFHKTDSHKYIPGLTVDAYKATINGEKIYTHFYINRFGYLVINSFHEP